MINAGHVVLKVSDTSLISLQQNNLWTASTVDRDNVQHNGDGIRFHLQVEGKMYKVALKLRIILNIYHIQDFTLLLT
jgi:hypothetical protein